jgi:hypothetical protein
MYGDVETGASRRYLDLIADRLDTEFCLVGGWAVHNLVREGYMRLTGREYLGSRDIDLGLPSPEGVLEVEALLVGDMGFSPRSFRFVKQLHFETGEELSDEAAKRLPLPMIFPLFVNVMIPTSGEKLREQLGFVPPDEPLLTRVFEDDDRSTSVDIGGRTVKVPTPDVLMAMKLNSVVNRFEDHKRIKDLCDLTALALYSGVGRGDLVERVLDISDGTRLAQLSTSLSRADVDLVGSILGIDPALVVGVITEFGWTS